MKIILLNLLFLFKKTFCKKVKNIKIKVNESIQFVEKGKSHLTFRLDKPGLYLSFLFPATGARPVSVDAHIGVGLLIVV